MIKKYNEGFIFVNFKFVFIKFFIIFSTLVTFIYSSNFVYSQDPEKEKKINEIIDNGIGFINQGKYNLGLEKFEELILELPDHPVGYFFKSGIILWTMIHFRKYDLENKFKRVNEQGIKVGKKFLREKVEDAWAYFFYGGLIGFRGIYFYEVESFFRAFFDGLHGVRQFKKVKKIDDSIIDVNYGFGLYDFWKSYYVYKILKDRNAIKGKEKGIQKLIFISENGKYVKSEARKALIKIYFTEEKYKQVIEIAEEEIKKYPDCLYCQRYLAVSYYFLGNYERSIQEFEKVREKIKISPFRNDFGILEADLFIVKNKIKNLSKKESQKLVDGIEKRLKEIDLRGKPNIFKANFDLLNKSFISLKKELK